MTIIAGCGTKDTPVEEVAPLIQDVEVEIKGDSMQYGLACDGSNDSVIVIWKFGGEPITYNCYDAYKAHRIIGKPAIGDWVGIMIDPEDTTSVDMVINLDQLKGTWTYPVMPVMKEYQNMSKRMQKRMMADMPDSIKETFMIPREYGFSLKRSHQAQSVGRVHSNNTLEDDSPVQYPEVKNYRKWYMLNGRLVLVSVKMPGSLVENNRNAKQEISLDTLDFVSMDNDSLIMSLRGIRYGFHRKESTLTANKEAMKAQEKIDSMKK